MTEIEQALLNLLQANPKIVADVIKSNPDIVLDVLKTNDLQTRRIFQVVPDAEKGPIYGYRKESDLEHRVRLSQNLDTNGFNTHQFPTWMYGDGANKLRHSDGYIDVVDNITGELRSLLEVNSRDKNGNTGNNIGIVFNTRDGHSISLTAEHGEIVVRDEAKGHEPIAIIK